MDEINLNLDSRRSLFKAFYLFRRLYFYLLASITFIFLIFNIFSPNLYRSEITVEPLIYEDSSISSASGLASSVLGSSGLNELLGSTLGDKNQILIGIEEFKSKEFQHKFLIDNNLLVDFFSIKRISNDKPVYDESVYSISKKQWNRKPDLNGSKVPNKNEIQRRFEKFLDVDIDSDSGLAVITFDFYSPAMSQQILSLMVASFNDYKRNLAVDISNLSIEYINQQLETVNKLEVRSIFYKMIESELKKVVFSKSRSDYFFRVVDPASLPDKKSNLSLSILLILSLILSILIGFMLMVLYISYPNTKFTRWIKFFVRS